MYMRASGSSELRNFLHFHIKNCYFFQYFVGTSETLSVQMTYLSAYMYRQNSENALLGGGGGAIAPPPPLATLVHKMEQGESLAYFCL